ncbi:hypothetical protein BT93_K1944, partial [Corymbia citriodora subsp. variegata]
MTFATRLPLLDTFKTCSSQPILSFENFMFILVSCLESEWVSVWGHGFQSKDEALLSLKFCDRHMRKTSRITHYLHDDLGAYANLSIGFSMTAYEHPDRDQIGFWVENLEIEADFSVHCLRVHLQCPGSAEKLQYFTKLCNYWHEKHAQVHGSASRRSFKNCMLHRLRKTRWGRLQAKRKRYLRWSCLDYYRNKRLLMYLVYLHACCVSFDKKYPRTKLSFCLRVLLYGFMLLHSRFDVEETTRLRWGSPLLVKFLRKAFDIETPSVKEVYLFFEDIYIRLFQSRHWDLRRSDPKSFARRVLKLPKLCGGHPLTVEA